MTVGDGAASDVACVPTEQMVMGSHPDILVVLDASGSMDNDIEEANCDYGCGLKSKWALTTAAVKQVVSATGTSVSWGLKFFADQDQMCTVSPGVSVPVSLGNASAISTAIAGRTSPMAASPTEGPRRRARPKPRRWPISRTSPIRIRNSSCSRLTGNRIVRRAAIRTATIRPPRSRSWRMPIAPACRRSSSASARCRPPRSCWTRSRGRAVTRVRRHTRVLSRIQHRGSRHHAQ